MNQGKVWLVGSRPVRCGTADGKSKTRIGTGRSRGV